MRNRLQDCQSFRPAEFIHINVLVLDLFGRVGGLLCLIPNFSILITFNLAKFILYLVSGNSIFSSDDLKYEIKKNIMSNPSKIGGCWLVVSGWACDLYAVCFVCAKYRKS